MKHLLNICWLFALLATLPALASPAPEPAAAITPGLEGSRQLTWKGVALQPAQTSDEAPLILRIASSQKAADGSVIYDLRWMPFVPGDYDLRDLLRGPGDRPVAGLPAMPVHVGTLLPPQHDGKLLCPEPARLQSLSGYYRSLFLLWTLWAAAGTALFSFIFWHRSTLPPPPPPKPRPTWDELLRPLVATAAERPLTPAEQVRLDTLLIAFWRQRLGLDGLTTPEALARLRADPDAGMLLAALDRWFYAPPGRHSPDLATVLAPYGRLAVEPAGQEVAR
jgi:hypothetical protein